MKAKQVDIGAKIILLPKGYSWLIRKTKHTYHKLFALYNTYKQEKGK